MELKQGRRWMVGSPEPQTCLVSHHSTSVVSTIDGLILHVRNSVHGSRSVPGCHPETTLATDVMTTWKTQVTELCGHLHPGSHSWCSRGRTRQLLWIQALIQNLENFEESAPKCKTWDRLASFPDPRPLPQPWGLGSTGPALKIHLSLDSYIDGLKSIQRINFHFWTLFLFVISHEVF